MLNEKILNQLESWKSNHLSFTGRLEFLIPVIYSYQYYLTAAFQVPMKTIHKLEGLMSSFLREARIAEISHL